MNNINEIIIELAATKAFKSVEQNKSNLISKDHHGNIEIDIIINKVSHKIEVPVFSNDTYNTVLDKIINKLSD